MIQPGLVGVESDPELDDPDPDPPAGYDYPDEDNPDPPPDDDLLPFPFLFLELLLDLLDFPLLPKARIYDDDFDECDDSPFNIE